MAASLNPVAKESAWLKKLREEKGIKSKTLDAMPELFPDVIWVWNTFQLLSETRDYGFSGPLRIKPSDMKAVLDMKGIVRGDDLDFALRVIPILDGMWIDDHYKRAEAGKTKDKGTK